MTKIFAIAVFAVLATACSREPIEDSATSKAPEPFAGVDLAKLSAADRQVITEASEDFQAVLSGKKPIHAVFDKDADLPSDGGTTFYKGKHYRLTATMTLASFGSFNGVAFGPRLEFDNTFSPGFNQEISSIRVYSNEQLAAQLHGL
jgi:hypothetical protein